MVKKHSQSQEILNSKFSKKYYFKNVLSLWNNTLCNLFLVETRNTLVIEKGCKTVLRLVT